MSKKFNVYMSVRGTAVVTVEAETTEDALRIASDEYSESSISICHQCSDKIDDPTYGDAVEAWEVEIK